MTQTPSHSHGAPGSPGAHAGVPKKRTGGGKVPPPVYLVRMVPDPWVRVAGKTAPRLAPATGGAYSLVREDAPAVVVRDVPKIGVQAKLVD